jgi:hypothetical protein
MNFLQSYVKSLDIAVLLILLFAMDLLHLNDPELKYLLIGLVSSLTGFRGLTQLTNKGTSP